MPLKEKTEHALERVFYGSRWILAPLYIDMSLVLLALPMSVRGRLSKH